MMKKLLFFILFAAAGKAYCQNLHFSLYQMFPTSLNPALTGNTDADYRISAIHRQQWKSLNSLFETTGISAETSFKNAILRGNKLGIGLTVLSDEQGNGIIDDLHLGLSAAYHHIFGANNRAQLSIGLSGTYRQTKIDYASLQFSDQYEYFVFNPDLATTESLSNELYGNISLNAGTAISYKLSSRSSLNGGFSVFNMLKPGNSALGLSEKTIAGMQLHSGIIYQLNAKWATYPNIRITYQGGSYNAILGDQMSYSISPSQKMDLLLGLSYRHNDAFIVSGGFKWKDLKIMGAYDFTVSKLNDVKEVVESTKGAGAFELALVFELRRVKASANSVTIPCKIF